MEEKEDLTKINIKSVDLFKTTILVSSLTDLNTVNHDLQKDILDIKKNDKTNLKKSNVGGWHSEYNLNQRNEESLKKLHLIVNEVIFKVYESLGGFETRKGVKLNSTSWANVSSGSDFQSFHTHPGWSLSAVYYVKVPDHSKLVGDAGCIQFDEFSNKQQSYNSVILKDLIGPTRQSIKPNPGMLIVFPSYIPHSVYPTGLDEERISVAFNFIIEKDS